MNMTLFANVLFLKCNFSESESSDSLTFSDTSDLFKSLQKANTKESTKAERIRMHTFEEASA